MQDLPTYLLFVIKTANCDVFHNQPKLGKVLCNVGVKLSYINGIVGFPQITSYKSKGHSKWGQKIATENNTKSWSLLWDFFLKYPI